jgi:hypothetical protein
MRALVVALGILLTFSCSGGGATAVVRSPSATPIAYRLLTHCGISYTRFEGTWYYPDPPNPKGTWSNPYDVGTMTRIDKDAIAFTDAAGNRAVFTTHPKGAIPTLQGCD